MNNTKNQTEKIYKITKKPFPEPMHEKVYDEIYLNFNRVIGIKTQVYEDRSVVDIREYYLKDNEWHPSLKKAIRIESEDEFLEFQGIIKSIDFSKIALLKNYSYRVTQ